jgi:NAD(P)-dependent dehydrogenase (short-subunit alcohol dehydrogenase family)
MTAKPVALVTGSASGIGAAIARRLSQDGYAVIVHARTSKEAGTRLANELGDAVYLQADLADEAARLDLIGKAASI